MQPHRKHPSVQAFGLRVRSNLQAGGCLEKLVQEVVGASEQCLQKDIPGQASCLGSLIEYLRVMSIYCLPGK